MGKTIRVIGFPAFASAINVKEFLEKYTGEGTVYATRIKRGKREFAIVQFKADKDAELIVSLAASQWLWHGRNYLKAWKCDHDIVSKPRALLHCMDYITLHFGCQTSTQRFATLWKGKNTSVSFGIGMKKMFFFLSHLQAEYKLELSYENIQRIHLHHCHGQPMKQLLIQLVGAPRIYGKETQPSGQEEDFYIRDIDDDQWVRTTDFTLTRAIGQSSDICLEIPFRQKLPDFKENFGCYKEDTDQLSLESSSSYSCNLEHVPIVAPPEEIKLPYSILFKVCSLVQKGYLPGLKLDANFYELVDPHRKNIASIEYALGDLKERRYEPVEWLREKHKEFVATKRHPKPSTIALGPRLLYIHRVQISPSKIYFCGPEVNVSNRVLRNYPDDIDNFLRVSFADEESGKMFSTDLISKSSSAIENEHTAVYRRILSTLRNGISIGSKNFEFLAFSTSQIRESSTWFFASRPGLTAWDIRAWMGDFSHIKNAVKYATRLGQSLSSSIETLTAGKSEIEIIPDVVAGTRRVKYNFSDGIGKISAEFARGVSQKCGLTDFIPSAFQIRYGGYKGVVAVDPSSSKKLSLRDSMCKYDSPDTKLNVLEWSKHRPCFLNRQLITLLSTLGVPDHVFEKKQREAIRKLDSILTDPLREMEALQSMPRENIRILRQMLLCGYRPDSEPFLLMMMRAFRASKLFDLRTKTRIFVSNGNALMGCLDETRTLIYGQVFVQVSKKRFGRRTRSHVETIIGNVVVAKNPCMHPGDVRVLQAVDVPGLHHFVDCVVFPQKGSRPHPNECSGSDLDGDIYFVCWDHELIPSRQIPPMDYTPQPTMIQDHDVTIEEVEEYFTSYMVNDSLGIISNAHAAFADREPQKAMSRPCLTLAKQFSVAVDFPKTGVPAVIPSHLHVKEYPDFMEKPGRPSYESQNVIGRLFREVRDLVPDTSLQKCFTRETAARSYDPDMEFDGYEDYLEDAFYHKTNYDYKLRNLMAYYGIETEAEILSGGAMKMSRSFSRRGDAEAISQAVRSLRKEARSWFNEQGNGEDSVEEMNARASAWYRVTYHPSYYGAYSKDLDGDHYLSFPWCVSHKLIAIKRNAVRRSKESKYTQINIQGY